jgi:hypothetical protein
VDAVADDADLAAGDARNHIPNVLRVAGNELAVDSVFFPRFGSQKVVDGVDCVALRWTDCCALGFDFDFHQVLNVAVPPAD